MISVGYRFYGLGFEGNPLEVTTPTTPIILIPMNVLLIKSLNTTHHRHHHIINPDGRFINKTNQQCLVYV